MYNYILLSLLEINDLEILYMQCAPLSLLKETWVLVFIGSIKTCSYLPSVLDRFI